MPVSKPSVITDHTELLLCGLERKTRTETPRGETRAAELTLAVVTLASSASSVSDFSDVAPGRVTNGKFAVVSVLCCC